MGHTVVPDFIAEVIAVHPHIRGAYFFLISVCRSAIGSSPHTWGIHLQPARQSVYYRFIPTYVGHTVCIAPNQFFKSVHPHIRGAYRPLPWPKMRLFGSSPHTWGIPVQRGRRNTPTRFIPTYVGHTVVARRVQDVQCGSSPHTWGIRPQWSILPCCPPVHPHIRGAYGFRAAAWAVRSGSSPHTWGIHNIRGFHSVQSRFIPTYVGHTLFLARCSQSLPVHPHIRGAYTGLP